MLTARKHSAASLEAVLDLLLVVRFSGLSDLFGNHCNLPVGLLTGQIYITQNSLPIHFISKFMVRFIRDPRQISLLILGEFKRIN